MKLIIGNKNYSSWSLRGWLACKQSGIGFKEETVSLYGKDWEKRKSQNDLIPSNGKVPILWDNDVVVWDSLAIIDWLAQKVGNDRFWPKDAEANAMARSLSAEMHSGFQALRSECPMNIKQNYSDFVPSDAAKQDAIRIVALWAEARSRFGGNGPYLFGTFSAADIMYAPIVSRFKTYGFILPGFAQTYCDSILEHSWIENWYENALAEKWILDRFER